MALGAVIGGAYKKLVQVTAQEAADALAPSGYEAGLAMGAQANPFGSVGMAYFVFDYTETGVVGTNLPPGPTFCSAEVTQSFDLKGTWMYIDRSSIGAPLLTFQKDSADVSNAVASPGTVIHASFDRFTLRYAPIPVSPAYDAQDNLVLATQSTNQLGAQLVNTNPCFRFWYGVGECPFESSISPDGSDAPCLISCQYLNGGGAGSGGLLASFVSPPGAVMNVDCAFGIIGNTNAAPVPYLGYATDLVQFEQDSLTNYLLPDSCTVINQGGTQGTIVLARWINRTIPRGVYNVGICCDDTSNEANTNVAIYNPKWLIGGPSFGGTGTPLRVVVG